MKQLLLKIKIIFIIIFLVTNIFTYNSLAAYEKIEGLEYVLRKIENPPIDKDIARKFELYEFYLENRSNMTFSIPGYSIDLGLDYSSASEIKSLYKNKSSNKLAIFNIAAGAASIALGGIAKTAASTIRTVGSMRKSSNTADDDANILSPNKIYILYPGEGLSLFLFVDKYLEQTPVTVRFVCHDEDLNSNYVLINNKVDLREINAESKPDEKEKNEENVIAAPSSDVYK
ncbi:MAG: hypothetical protein A3B68_05810 [Candidatus Melainabacteria bacterium RIFCSPHIGHO2_02_FULL_34_12]|nr:MAG: hypothetical protein A3B68_05810 [Candidatus Melainabacteria bacterium RIFCSPHIGHO2_02_FULL_34_12]